MGDEDRSGYSARIKLLKLLSLLVPVTVTVPIPNPSLSGLYWIMPDPEPRNNPATQKSMVDLFFKVSTKMSAYIHSIERLLNPKMSTNDLEQNLRALFGGQTAFSNGHAYDSGDWAIENLDCGGATVRAAGDNLILTRGKLWLPIKAIDPTSPPDIPASLDKLDPTMHFMPTISVPQGLNPFPMFSGRCAVPRLGAGGIKHVEWDVVHPVTSVQNPFVPAMPDRIWWGTTPPPPTPLPPPILDGMVLEEIWFGKALYQKYQRQSPRKETFHIVQFKVADLADIVIDKRVSVTETSTFLHQSGVQIAINGPDGFTSMRKGGKVITSINGFASYHGSYFGNLNTEQTLWIDKDLNFSFIKPRQIWSACSFPNLLIMNGAIQPLDKPADDIHARTAFGISKDGKSITILVVDGGDVKGTQGISFDETSKILLACDVWTGIMGDGGGSSTLVRRGDDGNPLVVNKPMGENSDGERSVAIHMGFRFN